MARLVEVPEEMQPSFGRNGKVKLVEVPEELQPKSGRTSYATMIPRAPGAEPIIARQPQQQPQPQPQAPKAPFSGMLSPSGETRIGRFLHGMMDPMVGIGQLAANLSPARSDIKQGLNQIIGQQEQQYQQSRPDQGIDWARLGGNIANPINLYAASKVPAAAAGLKSISGSTLYGAGQAATQPVTQGDYWTEKGTQATAGALGGAIAAPLAAGGARMIRPKISGELQTLIDLNVKPTLGQRLGPTMNRLEQKAMSIPIFGDMIASARNKTREEFNRGIINRVLEPIGATTDDIGNAGIAKASQKIGDVYDKAKSMIGHFQLDQQAESELQNLQRLSSGLVPSMRNKFAKIFDEYFTSRISPNRSFLSDVYKTVDSDLAKQAREWSSSSQASERELGSAVAELRRIISDNARRANPQAHELMRNADEAYARLVRIEAAGKSAKASEGVFTPGQLLTGITQADKSVRKRAISHGKGLLQKEALAGQSVIGNTVPNSFTSDRAMLSGGALGAGFYSPAIPVGLAAAGLPWAPGGRQAMHALTTQRPAIAEPTANLLRQSAPYAIPSMTPFYYGLLNGSNQQ